MAGMKAKKKKKPAKFSINKMAQAPEGYSHANENRAACQLCGRYKSCADPFSTPEIRDEWTGKILLVSDHLGRQSLSLAKSAWEAAGYVERDIAIIPPIRCQTTKAPSVAQLRACRPFLLKAIDALSPKFVLGLGAVALRALTNKSDANLTRARGKLINLKEKK